MVSFILLTALVFIIAFFVFRITRSLFIADLTGLILSTVLVGLGLTPFWILLIMAIFAVHSITIRRGVIQ